MDCVGFFLNLHGKHNQHKQIIFQQCYSPYGLLGCNIWNVVKFAHVVMFGVNISTSLLGRHPMKSSKIVHKISRMFIALTTINIFSYIMKRLYVGPVSNWIWHIEEYRCLRTLLMPIVIYYRLKHHNILLLRRVSFYRPLLHQFQCGEINPRQKIFFPALQWFKPFGESSTPGSKDLLINVD